jgi:hypothetical protein
MDAEIDLGSGYSTLTSGVTHALSSIVVDECYPTFSALRVTHPGPSDGWAGSFSMSTDAGARRGRL